MMKFYEELARRGGALARRPEQPETGSRVRFEGGRPRVTDGNLYIHFFFDVGLAEDLAQDALVAALEQWPRVGVPDNPGAWLMATAKHRAIDRLRRSGSLERKHEELGRELEIAERAGRTSTPRSTTTSATTCCA